MEKRSPDFDSKVGEPRGVRGALSRKKYLLYSARPPPGLEASVSWMSEIRHQYYRRRFCLKLAPQVGLLVMSLCAGSIHHIFHYLSFVLQLLKYHHCAYIQPYILFYAFGTNISDFITSV